MKIKNPFRIRTAVADISNLYGECADKAYCVYYRKWYQFRWQVLSDRNVSYKIWKFSTRKHAERAARFIKELID